MSHVVRQLQSFDIVIFLGCLLYELPCGVAAAVIDEQESCGDMEFAVYLRHYLLQMFHGPGQHFLLIIAGNDDIYGHDKIIIKSS